MTMIRNDEELAVQLSLLSVVEGIVDSWRKKLLPHNPKNFAIYAEGAIEQAEKLRAEIDGYLAQKQSNLSATSTTPTIAGHKPTKVS